MSRPRAIWRRFAKALLISWRVDSAMLTTRSSGMITSGILGGDLKWVAEFRTHFYVLDLERARVRTCNLWYWDEDSLLVNEWWGIRPEKENTQREYESMAKESQKMVAKQFKKDPDCSCTTEYSSRDVLVPPHKHVSGCRIEKQSEYNSKIGRLWNYITCAHKWHLSHNIIQDGDKIWQCLRSRNRT